jgi:hypothetical protein
VELVSKTGVPQLCSLRLSEVLIFIAQLGWCIDEPDGTAVIMPQIRLDHDI